VLVTKEIAVLKATAGDTAGNPLFIDSPACTRWSRYSSPIPAKDKPSTLAA